MMMPHADPIAMIQAQLVSMTAMKPDSTILGIVFACFVGLTLKHVVKLLEHISQFIETKLSDLTNSVSRNAKQTIAQTITTNLPGLGTGHTERKTTALIVMERVFDTTSNGNNSTSNPHQRMSSNDSILPTTTPAPGQETADALIEMMSLTVSAERVRLIHHYYVEHGNPIVLSEEDDIHIRTSRFTKEASTLKHMEIEVWSHSKNVIELQQWVAKAQQNYVISRSNKLGNQLYYFDAVPSMIPIASKHGGVVTYDWDRAPKEFMYHLVPFKTTKRLTNIFGEEADIIRERVDFFLNTRSWYEKHGVPYTLGILIKGQPGVGKTTCVKAIAHESGRHIFNVSLRGATRSQLTHLFQSERVSVTNRLTQRMEQLIIPIERRLYLFEDVDCMSDVVLDREFRNQNQHVTAIHSSMGEVLEDPSGSSGSKSPEEVDLAFLLNLFDGVAESNGRLMLWTSNYPERLDRALIRPGRIDVNVEMGTCTSKTINEMLKAFMESDYKDGQVFTEKVLTPAEVQECIFRHSHNFQDAVNAIRALIEDKNKNVNSTVPSEPAFEPLVEIVPSEHMHHITEPYDNEIQTLVQTMIQDGQPKNPRLGTSTSIAGEIWRERDQLMHAQLETTKEQRDRAKKGMISGLAEYEHAIQMRERLRQQSTLSVEELEKLQTEIIKQNMQLMLDRGPLNLNYETDADREQKSEFDTLDE
jgi:hypothetical protein